MRKLLFLLFCVITFTIILPSLQSPHADIPEKKEQLVYKILAFNGKDYSHTFCREDADTFYLLSNTDNFVSVRKTFVYFWPITRQWNTDYETLNEVIDGYIEIKKKKSSKPQQITKVKYTYCNVRAEYENNWKVFRGEEAYRELEKWGKMYHDYIEAVEKYHKEYEIYRRHFNELLQAANDLRRRGQDVTAILQEIDSLEQPEEPFQPQYYNVPPVPVEEAYILNLQSGEYGVRLILPNGKVLEGSEKTVVSFAKQRGNWIGYDIIPGDKWTRPVQNKTPSSVIFVNGKADIFLRPFFQDEYNDLYYNKLLRNDSAGNPHMYSWKRIQQVPGGVIELLYRDKRGELIKEAPFVVEQVKGSGLGYSIVPYDPEGEHAGRLPNLIAFRIPREWISKHIRLRLLDKNHVVIPNSEREMRVIRGTKYRRVPALFIFFPILSLCVIFVVRRRSSVR